MQILTSPSAMCVLPLSNALQTEALRDQRQLDKFGALKSSKPMVVAVIGKHAVSLHVLLLMRLAAYGGSGTVPVMDLGLTVLVTSASCGIHG